MNELLLKSEIGNFRRIGFVVAAFLFAFIGYKVLEQSRETDVFLWILTGALWVFALLSLTAPFWLAEIFIYQDRIVVKKIGGLYYNTILRKDITRFDMKKTPKDTLIRFYSGDEKVFTLSTENYENFWEMQDMLLEGIPGAGKGKKAFQTHYGYDTDGQTGETPSGADAHTSATTIAAHIQLPLIAELPHDHNLNIFIQGANMNTRINGSYAATLVAAYTRYLGERPRIEGGAEWLRKVQRLVQGIPVQQGLANSIYVDLVEME